VRSDLDHTFATFIGTLRDWWPVDPFSAGKDRVREITIEQRLGGRVYEVVPRHQNLEDRFLELLHEEEAPK